MKISDPDLPAKQFQSIDSSRKSMNFHFEVYLRQQEKKHSVNKSALSIPMREGFTENDFQESLKLTKSLDSMNLTVMSAGNDTTRI